MISVSRLFETSMQALRRKMRARELAACFRGWHEWGFYAEFGGDFCRACGAGRLEGARPPRIIDLGNGKKAAVISGGIVNAESIDKLNAFVEGLSC